MTQSIEVARRPVRVPLESGRGYSIQAAVKGIPLFVRTAATTPAPAVTDPAWFRLEGVAVVRLRYGEALWAVAGVDVSGAGHGNTVVYDECD